MKILDKKTKEFSEIVKFVRKLGISPNVLDKLGNLVKESKFVYSVNDKLLNHITSIDHRFFFVGTSIGELRQKGFFPNPEFIDFLSKRSEDKIIINDKSEWMFLCGKDIFKSGVSSDKSKDSARNVFVQNKNNENLGLAGSFKNGQYYHILDKGAYVRKEI